MGIFLVFVREQLFDKVSDWSLTPTQQFSAISWRFLLKPPNNC